MDYEYDTRQQLMQWDAQACDFQVNQLRVHIAGKLRGGGVC